jgi:hypothetical protein
VIRAKTHIVEVVAIVASIAVAAGTAYNVWMRHLAIPAVLRYVPPDSAGYVFTASLRSLWNSANPHVGSFFEDHPKSEKAADAEGVMRTAASALKKRVVEAGLTITRPDDLLTAGIDPDGAAAIAGVMGDDVLILPLADKEKFLNAARRFLVKAQPDARAAGQEPPPSGPFERIGRWFVAFPGSGSVVLATDENVLGNCLSAPAANLEFFRSRDDVVRAFASLMTPTEQFGRGWLRGAVNVGMASGPLFFSLVMHPDRMRIRADFRIPDSRSKHLEKLVERGNVEPAAAARALAYTNLAIMVADPALPLYLRLLRKEMPGNAQSSLGTLYQELLRELERHDVHQVSISAGTDASGVPDIVLGINMDKAGADDLLFRLQKYTRIERDTKILRSARDEYRRSIGSADAPITTAQLVQSPDFDADRRFFTRYKPNGDSFFPDPPLNPADFRNERYRKKVDEHEIAFLLPPITDVDFRYRLSPETIKRVSREDLQSDRHRVGAVHANGTLWIGNDADVLSRWMRTRASAGQAASWKTLEYIVDSKRPSKVTMLANPPQLLEQALLHPDPAVGELANRMLTEIQQYRVLLLVLAAREGERTLRAELDLVR